MDSKNIVDTGASRGIGFELVKLLSEQNHQVLAITRNKDTIIKLQKTHENITVLEMEITQKKDLKAFKEFLFSLWKKVDVVIHNAGALIHRPFFKTTFEDFMDVYKVNVFAVAELTKIVLPLMKKGGHLVAISSMGGIQGSKKFAGLSAYSSSKGAVITLFELLAEEYANIGINFNVLALGAVQTEMLANAFPGFKASVTPLEMAKYISDFALEQGHLFNGKVIEVSNSTP